MAITRKGRFLNAVRRNDIKKVERFLDAGFPVEYSSWTGNNALLFAVIHGHKDMAEMLIRRGANFARYYGHYALGEDCRQDTLLHIAAERGHKDIVLMLLEHDKYDRSLIGKPDGNANTALHLAAAQGHSDIIKILVDHGFDPAAKGQNGKTPVGFAHQGGHENVVKQLSEMIRKAQPAPAAKEAPQPAWKLVSETTVAHVSEMPDIGYRMTDVFNFASGERIRIVNNLKTKADNIETTPFAELADRAQVEDAYRELVKLGGKVSDAVLQEKAAPRSVRLTPPGGPR